MEIIKKKNASGLVNLAVRIPIRNNITDIGGRFPNEKMQNIAEFFLTNFGVHSFNLPEYTELEISDIDDDVLEIRKGEKIMQLLVDILQERYPSPMTAHIKSANESQKKFKEANEGTGLKNLRNPSEQKTVEEAFQLLKRKGARPTEWDKNRFHIWDLRQGFFKPTHLTIESIDELEKFAHSYNPK
jgi:hypothetical protein